MDTKLFFENENQGSVHVNACTIMRDENLENTILWHFNKGD